MKEVYRVLTQIEYQVGDLHERARALKERIDRLKEKMDVAQE